jgi:hypothetical protein
MTMVETPVTPDTAGGPAFTTCAPLPEPELKRADPMPVRVAAKSFPTETVELASSGGA